MNARRRLLLAGITSISWVTALGQSPPPNDNFDNRTVVTGSSVTLSGTLVGTTLEAAEPNSWSFPYFPWGGVISGSVWWSWTAPRDSTVVIQPLRDYSVPVAPVFFEVYTGTSLDTLTPITGEGFSIPFGRYAEFSATAGVTYQIQVAGSWTSSFSLKLTATNSPVFLIQPQSCTVSPYGSAFFSALANLHDTYNSGPLNSKFKGYQWAFNGVPIPGEIYPCLLIHSVTTNQAGNYSVIASNSAGVTESAVAVLTVTDTNPVPRIAAVRPSDATHLPFTLAGEPGRWYKVESSQDFRDWGDPTWVLPTTTWIQPTNSSSLLSVSRLGPNHFVRASLNAKTDVCVAQLKQLRAACATFTIVNRLSPTAAYFMSDLKPYLPLTEGNALPPCPEGGYYSGGSTVTNAPTCNISHGHYIVDP